MKPENKMISDELILVILAGGLGGAAFMKFYSDLSAFEAILFVAFSVGVVLIILAILWEWKSKSAREHRKRLSLVKALPVFLKLEMDSGVYLGFDEELKIRIFLPDSIRRRHIHILGATGSGKTESVILNLIRQDSARKLGCIILDAKGDTSFLKSLEAWIPKDKLQVFDLGSKDSLPYDPLATGSPLEASQRLFASLTWSEEYYKSKAFSTLQRLFQIHYSYKGTNPQLTDIDEYLEDPETFTTFVTSPTYPKKLAERDFMELSGLRDQIKTLCTGHLAEILSSKKPEQIDFAGAHSGNVLYFRLQSLMSAQLVSIVGKLVINHLNYLAGVAHRSEDTDTKKLVPVYLDEFASFACPEFADLISKARSAGFALHFSHQSVGDLKEVSEGFINRITDNSGTKIVMRINDPDSADFFARSFGTKLYQKTTQRITNAKSIDTAEVLEEGTQREAHQFRASPDLFKTLPTGVGSVLISHGEVTPHGASSVFKIRFPRLPDLATPKTKKETS